MPYQLMVRSRSYLPIDIRRHPKFIINSNLKNGSSNLDEIDLFTMQFYGATDLKLSLINEGLLSPKFINNEIAIRYKNGDYDTMKDSIIYSDLKAYLDEDTLEKTLRILSDDKGFIDKLVDNYMPKDDTEQMLRPCINYEVLSILSNVSNYNIEYVKRFILPYRKNINYIRNIDYTTINREILTKILVTIFYYNEVYKRNFIKSYEYDNTIRDYKDYYIFSEKVQYRNFHDLALFVGNYDLERRKREEKEYQEEFLEPGEMVFSDEYVLPVSKPKKRVKKPVSEVEGQMTFL